MKLSHFSFNLPNELLAEFPTENRDESRLMVVNRKTNTIEHKLFKDVIDYFDDGDVMVLNNTKVFPARLYGNKEKTGARIEVFLLRELNAEQRLWDVLVDPARKIRKITPAGVVTTIAGSTPGYNDGNVATAQFDDPRAMAIDSSGNIYVADSANHKIRKIATDGTVSTLAGSTQGYQNGAANTAKFNFPSSIVLDLNSLYVGESGGNYTIRKITGGALSIQENLLEEKNKIYPNPVKDILNIQSDEEVKTVEVYNSLGQKVMNGNKNQVDVSFLSKGVYILRVENKYSKITIQKFIKE